MTERPRLTARIASEYTDAASIVHFEAFSATCSMTADTLDWVIPDADPGGQADD